MTYKNTNKKTYNRQFEEKPKVNVESSIKDLSRRFYMSTQSLKDNKKGTDLYNWQVEFTYIIDQIQRGPIYIAPKFISMGYNLISEINQTIRS